MEKQKLGCLGDSQNVSPQQRPADVIYVQGYHTAILSALGAYTYFRTNRMLEEYLYFAA